MAIMKKHVIGFLSIAALLLSAGVQAAVVNWTGSLDAAQEVPSNASPGTGSAFGTLDDATGLLGWNISWSGLSGQAVAMHFHGPAGPGVNTGVQVNIGSISGLISASIGFAVISASQMNDFLDDKWYINIHTSSFPGGEIRGQVITVPEPSTLALLGLALLGVAAARRAKS